MKIKDIQTEAKLNNLFKIFWDLLFSKHIQTITLSRSEINKGFEKETVLFGWPLCVKKICIRRMHI